MSMEANEQIRFSVAVLIILGFVLTACMFVQCLLLIFSATRKNKVQSGDPDSVVVKGGSKKSKKCSRSSSKSSNASSEKPCKSQCSSKDSASSLASEVKKKTRTSKKVAKSIPAKASRPRPMKSPKTFEGFQTDDFSAGSKTDDLNAKVPDQFGSFTTGTNTSDLNDRIPDQFGIFTAGVKTSELNAKVPDQFGDISTEKINAAIPNQFDNSLAGISNQQLIAGQKNSQLVRQVAEQVIAYLAANKTPVVGSTKTPDSAQSSLPKQTSPVPAPRVYADSFFMMETGSNGETNKVDAKPSEQNVTNSLILDSQKVVPIDGRPEVAANSAQAQPPIAQQSPPVSAPKAMADSVYIINQAERSK